MSENSDKRWWLQICPVDVHPAPKMRKNGDVDIRARRQIPVEWSNSRFSYTPEQQIPSKLKPFFRRGSQNINPNKWPRIPQRFNTLSVAEKEEEEETTTTAMIEQKNITENTTPTTTSKSVSRRLIPLRHSRLLQFNEKARTRSTPQETTTENVKTITQTTPINSNEPKKTTTTHPTDVLDYYDILQDGLTLAQAAFPAKINMERSDGNGRKGFQLRIAVTNPPNTVDLRNRKETELAFSKDEASSSSHERDDSKRWDDRHNIGSFVQQSDSPVPQKKIIPKRPEATKRESVNTIESMLQMIGLCQGHPEL
uniref:Uncharacterized protein n=1 Tax=Meloidogyne incognita TaxID=6306 RepID=A0A914L257_MELIC